MKMRKKASLFTALAAAFVLIAIPAGALAATGTTTTNLSQTINALNFSVGAFDGETPQSSLAATFVATDFSFACQQTTAVIAPTAGTEKVTITNPNSSNVSLSLSATAGDLWTGDQSTPATYDYNGVDCQDGFLEVGTNVTLDATARTAPTVSKPGGSFASATADKLAVTVLETSNSNPWEGDVKNIDLTQHIPAETEPGNYTLDMTLSATQF